MTLLVQLIGLSTNVKQDTDHVLRVSSGFATLQLFLTPCQGQFRSVCVQNVDEVGQWSELATGSSLIVLHVVGDADRSKARLGLRTADRPSFVSLTEICDKVVGPHMGHAGRRILIPDLRGMEDLEMAQLKEVLANHWEVEGPFDESTGEWTNKLRPIFELFAKHRDSNFEYLLRELNITLPTAVERPNSFGSAFTPPVQHVTTTTQHVTTQHVASPSNHDRSAPQATAPPLSSANLTRAAPVTATAATNVVGAPLHMPHPQSKVPVPLPPMLFPTFPPPWLPGVVPSFLPPTANVHIGHTTALQTPSLGSKPSELSSTAPLRQAQIAATTTPQITSDKDLEDTCFRRLSEHKVFCTICKEELDVFMQRRHKGLAKHIKGLESAPK